MKITQRLILPVLLYLICMFAALDVFADSMALTQTFDGEANRYKIKYPANWISEDKGKGVILFKPSADKSPNMPSINIQTIYTKKAGGKYATVHDIMDDLAIQVPRQLPNSHLITRGPLTLPQSNGANLQGEYAIFTYIQKGIELKQWQIILLSKDGQVFQAWAFTSPVNTYDQNQLLAKAMLATWDIT